MVEFNLTYLASLVFAGFKFILYVPNEEYAELHPLKQEAPAIVVQAMGGWLVPICEKEIIEMAVGLDDPDEDSSGFKFYIAEDLFKVD